MSGYGERKRMRATEAEGKTKSGREGKAKRGEVKVGERKEPET